MKRRDFLAGRINTAVKIGRVFQQFDAAKLAEI
jgi:hypothetical protein